MSWLFAIWPAQQRTPLTDGGQPKLSSTIRHLAVSLFWQSKLGTQLFLETRNLAWVKRTEMQSLSLVQWPVSHLVTSSAAHSTSLATSGILELSTILFSSLWASLFWPSKPGAQLFFETRILKVNALTFGFIESLGHTAILKKFEFLCQFSKKQNMIKKNYQLNWTKKFVDKAQQFFFHLKAFNK